MKKVRVLSIVLLLACTMIYPQSKLLKQKKMPFLPKVKPRMGFNNRCDDIKSFNRKFQSLTLQMGKMKAESIKVHSMQLKTRNISGQKDIKILKKFPLKALKTNIKLITAEKAKMMKVASSYKIMKKHASDLRREIYLLDKGIARLTLKWKKQNLLKYKKNCLIALYNNALALKKKANTFKLASFSFGNQKTLVFKFKPSWRIKPNASGVPYKRQASEKDIEAKRAQMEQEIAEQMADAAKEGANSAKELWKAALRLLKEHAERQTQNVQALTRI